MSTKMPVVSLVSLWADLIGPIGDRIQRRIADDRLDATLSRVAEHRFCESCHHLVALRTPGNHGYWQGQSNNDGKNRNEFFHQMIPLFCHDHFLLRIEWCTVEHVMRLQHETRPHDQSLTVPIAADIFTVFVAGMVMDGAFVPNDDVRICGVLGRIHIVGELRSPQLRAVVRGHPEIVLGETFLMPGESSRGQGYELVVAFVAVTVD